MNTAPAGVFGADAAFHLQNPEYLSALPGERRLGDRMRERLVMAVTCPVATEFAAGRALLTLARRTRRVGVPMHAMQIIVRALQPDGRAKKGRRPARLPAGTRSRGAGRAQGARSASQHRRDRLPDA
jgi:hypothetical protein